MEKDYWDNEWQSRTWLDGKEFKQYAKTVEAIIHNAGFAMCTRDIHAALGDLARRNWTADALESICTIKAVGMNPTRYIPSHLSINDMEPASANSRESLRWIFQKQTAERLDLGHEIEKAKNVESIKAHQPLEKIFGE